MALEMLEVWERNSLDDTSCNVQHEKWKDSVLSPLKHTLELILKGVKM